MSYLIQNMLTFTLFQSLILVLYLLLLLPSLDFPCALMFTSTSTSVNQPPPLSCQDCRTPWAKLFPTRPLLSLPTQTVPGPSSMFKTSPTYAFPTPHYTTRHLTFKPHLDPAIPLLMPQERLHVAALLKTVILQVDFLVLTYWIQFDLMWCCKTSSTFCIKEI